MPPYLPWTLAGGIIAIFVTTLITVELRQTARLDDIAARLSHAESTLESTKRSLGRIRARVDRLHQQPPHRN